jgi:hypothetical protein
MLIASIFVDMIGYATARALLPIITMGKVSVQSVSSNEMGFNWFGYKVVDGKVLFSSTMGGWIGLFILGFLISIVILLISNYS